MSEMLLTSKSDLVAIADVIRAKAGTSDSLSFPQGFIDGVNALVEGFGQGGSGGSLEGLENGYDVMFYDENNEGLAFYSIKEGHSINAPEYTVKAWQTEDGRNVEFPFTPTEDLILYANNTTYATQLYNYYGVDKGVYPYVAIRHLYYTGNSSKPTMTLCFSKSTSFDSKYTYGAQVKTPSTSTIVDHSDVGSVVDWVMANISPSALAERQGFAFGDQSSYQWEYFYLNFGRTFTNSTMYRLDE